MFRQWRQLASLAALGLAVTTPIAAQTPTDIGILTCALAESTEPGAPVDESAAAQQARDMQCWFRPFREGPEETYLGIVRGAGQVRELFRKRVMIWIVKGTPTTRASPGLLQQTYAADPRAAPGHAPPLIGEMRSDIVLQPFADGKPPAPDNKVLPLDAIITAAELILKSSPG
jgi:hypothetical protein